jgi:hypothetical protein
MHSFFQPDQEFRCPDEIFMRNPGESKSLRNGCVNGRPPRPVGYESSPRRFPRACRGYFKHTLSCVPPAQ